MKTCLRNAVWMSLLQRVMAERRAAARYRDIVVVTARGQLQSGAVDLAGMTATIRYKELPGAPPRMILERR